MKKLFLHFFTVILLISVSNIVNAQSGKQFFEKLDKSKIKTAVLYDIITPFSKIEKYTGDNDETVTTEIWKQLYHEMDRASINDNSLQSILDVKKSVKSDLRKNIYTIGILNYKYNKFKQNALQNGLIKVENGQYIDVSDNPYDEFNVFAAAVIDSKKYTNLNVKFQFSEEYYFSNINKDVRNLEVNFDNGTGIKIVQLNELVDINYLTEGIKNIEITVFYNDNTKLKTKFIFDIKNPKNPSPDEHWENYTAEIDYNGDYADGDVAFYFGFGNNVIKRPVIIVDGFDPGDTRGIDGLYDIANEQNLADSLLANGYDLFLLNSYDGAGYIQKNAFLMVKLIQDINNRMEAEGTMKEANQIAIIGPSMGGLISRYAITYMEQNGMSHNVRNWISFDSPQKGANVPLGIQHWIRFFAIEAESQTAVENLADITTPAALQMLIYHYTATSENTAGQNTMKTDFYNEIDAMGFPQQTRKVSIINGSGYGNGIEFGAAEQIVYYRYESFTVDIDGNVWALPNQTDQRVFQGYLDKVWPIPNVGEDIYVNNTLPIDGAPGGYYDAIKKVGDANTGGYGNVVAYFDNHSFIGTISSLALENTTDPFFNVNENVESLDHPFDKIYYPVENQYHVEITSESYNWFKHEIYNYIPEFTSSPLTIVDEDSEYTYTYTAEDINEWNTLSFTIIEKPDWLSDSENTLSGTPTNQDVGTYNVSIQVSDGLDESIQEFTITVENTNDAPIITSIPVEFVLEDSQYTYTMTATDEDPTNDELIFTIPVKPDWLDIYGGILLLGTPTNEDVGTHDITINLFDGTVNVEQIFTITVENTNDAPTVENRLENQEAVTGEFFAYTFNENTFNDIDIDDELSYTATLSNDSDLPSWLIFNSNTRTFEGTPEIQIVLIIKVTAMDNFDESISDEFFLNISTLTGIEAISNSDIYIFPNPTTNNVNIEFNSKEINFIEIIDINGRILKSLETKKSKSLYLDLYNYTTGIYTIKFYSNDEIIYRKLILK